MNITGEDNLSLPLSLSLIKWGFNKNAQKKKRDKFEKTMRRKRKRENTRVKREDRREKIGGLFGQPQNSKSSVFL